MNVPTYTIMTSVTWLNLGQHGIFRDLRKHIYSYLNRADRLLVEAAHCSGTEKTANTFWLDCPKGSSRWYVLHEECSRYGYSAPLIWAITNYPNIHSTNDSGRLVWLPAAENNHIDFLESVAGFYKFSPEYRFTAKVIEGGARLPTVKWLLQHGAKYITGAYSAAVMALDFELAEYIESITYKCKCERESDIVPTVAAGHTCVDNAQTQNTCDDSTQIHTTDDNCITNPTSVKYTDLTAVCHYGICNLMRKSTPYYYNTWSRIFEEANVKAAEYLVTKSVPDPDFMSDAVMYWTSEGLVDCTTVVTMLSWMLGHGYEIKQQSSLYLFAAGWVWHGDDEDNKPEIIREPDLEMIKYLHSVGCDIGNNGHMVFFRSMQVYEWAVTYMPDALSYISNEYRLTCAIKYGTSELVERLLVGVVPTQRVLKALLKHTYYDIFDDMWKQFYKSGGDV